MHAMRITRRQALAAGIGAMLVQGGMAAPVPKEKGT